MPADTLPTADVRALLDGRPCELVDSEKGLPLAISAPTLARELIAAREERDKAEERADSDVARMQNVVYDALVSGVKAALPDADLGRIDGAGSDGDEFEFTEAEVSIALSMLDDALTEVRAERDRLTRELADLRANVRRFDCLAGESGYRHHGDGSRCLDPECHRAHALPAALNTTAEVLPCPTCGYSGVPGTTHATSCLYPERPIEAADRAAKEG